MMLQKCGPKRTCISVHIYPTIGQGSVLETPPPGGMPRREPRNECLGGASMSASMRTMKTIRTIQRCLHAPRMMKRRTRPHRSNDFRNRLRPLNADQLLIQPAVEVRKPIRVEAHL